MSLKYEEASDVKRLVNEIVDRLDLLYLSLFIVVEVEVQDLEALLLVFMD